MLFEIVPRKYHRHLETCPLCGNEPRVLAGECRGMNAYAIACEEECDFSDYDDTECHPCDVNDTEITQRLKWFPTVYQAVEEYQRIVQIVATKKIAKIVNDLCYEVIVEPNFDTAYEDYVKALSTNITIHDYENWLTNKYGDASRENQQHDIERYIEDALTREGLGGCCTSGNLIEVMDVLHYDYVPDTEFQERKLCVRFELQARNGKTALLPAKSDWFVYDNPYFREVCRLLGLNPVEVFMAMSGYENVIEENGGRLVSINPFIANDDYTFLHTLYDTDTYHSLSICTNITFGQLDDSEFFIPAGSCVIFLSEFLDMCFDSLRLLKPCYIKPAIVHYLPDVSRVLDERLLENDYYWSMTVDDYAKNRLQDNDLFFND